MGAYLAGKLLFLPLLAVGYVVYLVLISERRKKTPGTNDEQAGAISRRMESFWEICKMRKLPAFCVALMLVAGHATIAANDGESESLTPGAKAFIDRLNAESKIAQDALDAGGGDAAALGRLRMTAVSGDPYAQFSLAFLYRDGKGVPQSASEYLSWLQRSAAGGYAGAQVRLIGIYEKGDGVPKDLAQAAVWASRAAEQGDGSGIVSLMMDYYKGRGVPRDYVQAVKWYTIAIRLGPKIPREFFDRLKGLAGEEGVAEGEALAREWLANFQKAR